MPKIAIGTDIVNDFQKALQKEWIITNGMGGYASSTIPGCNLRRYHGLLVCSRPGDPERAVILSKIEETLKIGHRYYYLSTNKYTEDYIHPRGFTHMRKFQQTPFPRFIYTIKDITISKEIFMLRNSNTTVVRYSLFGGEGGKFSFYLHPLTAFRNFHELQKENRTFSTETQISDSTLTMQPYPNMPTLKLKAEGMEFKELKNWYKNFRYDKEKERGLDYIEDLFNPGYFLAEDVTQLEVDFIATCEEEVPGDIEIEYQKSLDRVEELFEAAGADEKDDDEKSLVLAADLHLINMPLPDKNQRTTIVAGYHWFGDWGRDTFIALPGITLSTGRDEEARRILKSFAGECKNGLIPNRFGDLGSSPSYNTVDASLWFINSTYEFARATRDYKFVKENLYQTCKSIIENYERGTDFNIGMDEDNLIKAGVEGVQLTWMDAKVDDWVVTPRHGKPVEINALWYNALCTMHKFACRFKDKADAEHYEHLAGKVKKNFNSKYWYERGQYLYDNLAEEGPDESLCPNQLIAISLPFPVLEEDKWKSVVQKVHEKLYIPFGIRSLSFEDPRYQGVFIGGVEQRDGAYHRGTAWGYLLGPFIEAYLKTYNFSKEALNRSQTMVDLWMGDLVNSGLNTLSEIFDGDEPFSPRGCISQAWTVAEALRIKKLIKKYQK